MSTLLTSFRKLNKLLDENDRLMSRVCINMSSFNSEGTLTWHGGVIPGNEVWIKLGGDKGGGGFKMNFQIVNTSSLNSIYNTCVFACFEAQGTIANLHIALDRYKEDVTLAASQWK